MKKFLRFNRALLSGDAEPTSIAIDFIATIRPRRSARFPGARSVIERKDLREEYATESRETLIHQIEEDK